MPRDFFESGKSYNVYDLRLEKTVNGVKTEYYYNCSILIAMADGTNTQKCSYDSTGNVVSVNFNGTEYYYLRNAQGDIVKLIDKNKNAVVEYTYDSWGKPVAVTGTLATTLGADQPFRYRGYVYDEETGWYYLQSRYYDPTTCRFISADVLLSTGQGVLGHNSFAYCGNNPVVRIDDQGQFWNIIGAIAIVVTTTIVSGVIGGLQEVANGGSFWTGAASGAVSGAIASAPAALATLTLGATAALTPGLTAAASAAGAVAGYGVKCAIKGLLQMQVFAARRPLSFLCFAVLSGEFCLRQSGERGLCVSDMFLGITNRGALFLILLGADFMRLSARRALFRTVRLRSLSTAFVC